MGDRSSKKGGYDRLGPFRMLRSSSGSSSSRGKDEEDDRASRKRSLFKDPDRGREGPTDELPIAPPQPTAEFEAPSGDLAPARPAGMPRIDLGGLPTKAPPEADEDEDEDGEEEAPEPRPSSRLLGRPPDLSKALSGGLGSARRRSKERTRSKAGLPRFRPAAPTTLREAGLTAGAVEALLVKYLAAAPGSSGRKMADRVGLPDRLVQELLAGLKHRKVVVHKGSAAIGDFYYELSETGRGLAFDLNKISRYTGRAPVTLEAYAKSVATQSVALEKPRMADLERAFRGLLIDDQMLGRLGPAINAGKGCFMFGPPGNGKTSIAERITRAYRAPVFIPYAVDFGGTLVRVFDPAVHEPVDVETFKQLVGDTKLDGRWVLCRRPTIVVGGELTMDALEVAYDDWSGTCEAPIQVKSNGGTLVIDDLGRQTMEPAALLNRWIVPMEKRVDFLRVPGGRKVEVPFDLMLVFSTNLEPRSLVDDAFLRRIPFKIDVHDPSEETFRELMKIQARVLELELDEAVIEPLLARHFRGQERPMRMCHPRDLLVLVKNLCEFREIPGEVTGELLDEAVSLYFSVV